MTDTTQQPRILLTGGGTGGHVFPAIAIADALRKMYPQAEFLFVGANGRMEMERVPQAGYRIEGLNIAGFQRGFSLRSLGKNLSFPFKLLSSSRKAKRIVRSFRPDVVIGTGGYASGPVMRASQSLGIPTLIQEQNSYPGVTNRLLAKRAGAVCVAYDGMEQWFPADKVVFTGNPVRQDIVDLNGKHDAGLSHFGLQKGLKTILITGGSLGARTLNEAMTEAAGLLADSPVQVLWQCGRFYIGQYEHSDTAQLPNVHILPFIDRVDLAYAASDVIIARAGALTISELCLVGKPAVLVPSPNVAEDHQTKNALSLVEKGAARLIRDVDAVEKMIPEALLVLQNEAMAFSLSESIRPLGRPNAAETIALEALKLIQKQPVQTDSI
ncbi:MAG TPA: undecaprenyldiphospho-muramoylpentapeptide beta-N-acetylglucosaminyltransferase [Saprospiraceae bacterium]|nr:undecaprenyldiphospho-muramoylpentapeptide beta-N-acetylglucosaminyltransferase [Saprospiraceae bacterium]